MILDIWECLWRITLITITEVGMHALSGWCHSLGIHCFLFLSMRTMWPVFWSSCCLGLPTVMDCNLELWAAISPSHPQLLLSGCFYYDNRKRSSSRSDCFVVDRYCFYSVYSLIVIVAAQRAQFTGKDWEWNTGLIEVNTISSLLWSSYSCTSQVLLLKEER